MNRDRIVNRPFVLPFFLPNQGCPHRCVYCDQGRSAGSRPEPLAPEAVARGIEQGLASPRLKPGARVEVGFFGGTFTALPLRRQEALLAAVRPFLDQGLVQALRLSTRPDALDRERIALLKEYGVETVEVGVQTMDDRILAAAGRGHDAERTRRAARLVKESGLRLGVQLLLGLPGEDDSSRAHTLEETMALGPDDARLYPLLVIESTPLAGMHRAGRYDPLSLEQAIEAAARMYVRMTRAGVRVIRMGLHADPKLAANLVAGPHHPAFGDLVKSEVFFQALGRLLSPAPGWAADPVILVSPFEMSAAVGHGRRNLKRLAARPGLARLVFRPDPA
ncbi:MAG: radical SAM protein, partial [Thermodesulfobacteriota bacterium]